MVFTERQRYTVGIITLLCVVLIWVGSSFLMNNIFGKQEYNKPFAITYINTASFSLYLLYFLCNKKRPIDKQRIIEFNNALYDALSRSSFDSTSEASSNSNDGMNDFQENIILQPEEHSMYSSSHELGLINDNNNSSFIRSHRETSDNHPHIDPHDVLSSMRDEEKLSTRQIAKLGFTFCILWFAANWSTNASLAYTSVASSTILSSTSGFFTLVIGSFVKVEKFTFLKLVAVLISFFGVYLISNGDTSNKPNDSLHPTNNSLFGDFLALIGAFFYGCYTILLKLRIQNESRVNMPLFFGFVGIFNVILLWPLFWLLHFVGLEPFQLPQNSTIWIMVAINALIGTFLSDYLWLIAVLMTSPLTVTLGLSLTIPLALLGDFFKGFFMSTGYFFGVIMVTSGFIGVNFLEIKEKSNDRKPEIYLENERDSVRVLS
ncbi:16576_t:CDS:2 [Funneliformis geosporum]|uniref:15148_t:CDS:1 n=1 Tax=Funneliformis geosporum TaxID=1117311 RepID=A0A9W4SN51_9GLOM|nr:16576_t:CDS:2 [Funneliformis geosporum]CAI2174443.1 15148_t:CDS:2 [Funneliformis geosporum]